MEQKPSAPAGKKRRRLLLLLIPALAVAVAAVLFSRYIFCAGQFYPRSAPELDLRDETLSVENYETLRTKLPNCNIRWSVPIGDRSFDSESTTVHPGRLSMEDIEHFSLFERLKKVDGSRCTDYDVLLALRTARPDLEIRWGVDIGGSGFSQSSQILRVKAENLTAGELMEKLPLLPELNKVTVTGAMDFDEQAELAKAYPHILFDWDVELLGSVFPSLTAELSYADRTDLTEADLDTLEEYMFLFPNLEVIDLTGCGFSDEILMAFRNRCGADIRWTVTLCGREFSTTDSEIDLSDIEMEDTAAVEAALPLFSRLEKVVMCNCGLSNEEMDALNKRHEGIRFVWLVQVLNCGVRSDTTYFSVNNPVCYYSFREPVSNLRYCPDLVALDLGHVKISDISYLPELPHLKYLIISDCYVRDLTPIASLKELIYLEMFLCPARDLSPLLECPKLEDLNICYIYARNGPIVDTLAQMTNLKRLWFCGQAMSPEELTRLQTALPDCHMELRMGLESTESGWREHENYYAMRDALNLYYMD